MPLEQLAIVVAIIFFAYCIRGITGFGSGLLSVPLLAHFFPLTFAVPFMLVLDFSAAVVLGRSTRHEIRWDELRPLLPFSVIGVLLGVSLLLHMPRESLLITLGLFVLIFGVRTLLNVQGERTISRWWAVPTALTGGTVGALFGTGGPPYIIYLTHRLRDKSALRATFSGLFTLEGGLRIVVFAATGLLLQEGMGLALLMAYPVMALGLYVGHRAHLGISNEQMLKLIGLILIVAGTSLLFKAAALP